MGILQHKEWLETTPLVVHNAKFEHSWMLSRGINANIVDDTQLMAYVYDQRLPLNLESLVLKFGIDKPFKFEHGDAVKELEGDRLRERNAADARNTIELRDAIVSRLTEEEEKVYRGVLLPASKSIARIELEGIGCDEEEVRNVVKELEEKLVEIQIGQDEEVKILSEALGKDFNPDSSVHCGMLVYDILGYEAIDYPQALTASGNPSSGRKVLDKLLLKKDSATLRKLIEYKVLKGARDYYNALLGYCDDCGRHHILDNVIYPNLLVGVAATGRISSSHPNCQNNPKGWTRRCYISKYGGTLLEMDYDQIELRILAGISGDEKLLDDFATGKDPHYEMYKEAFGTDTVPEGGRAVGKMLNFAIPFGRGAGGIAFETGAEFNEAKAWRNRYWKQHKKLKDYLYNLPKEGWVHSPTGMKRYVTKWTQARNHPIQNSALVAILMAINNVIDLAEEQGTPIDLTVHDSIRFDCKPEKKKGYREAIKEMMEFKAGEAFSWLPIPLTVSGEEGINWAEMKDI